MRQPIAQVTLSAENGGSLTLIFDNEGTCEKAWARFRAARCRAARGRAAAGPGREQGWRGPAAALRNLVLTPGTLLLIAVVAYIVVLGLPMRIRQLQ